MAFRSLRAGCYRVGRPGLRVLMLVRGVPDRSQPKRPPGRDARACLKAHPCSNARGPGPAEGREELDRPAVFPTAVDARSFGQRAFPASRLPTTELVLLGVLQPPCSTYSSIAALITSVRPTSFKEAAVRGADPWGVRVESGSPKLRFVRTTT